MPSSRTPLLLAALAALLAAVGWISPSESIAGPSGQHFGFASVLPALVTLLIVFVTREVISALFVGIVVGGAVTGGWNVIDAFMIPAIGSSSFAVILLVYLWALGGLIGLWTRTGGARYFAEAVGRRIVRGPRSAKFFAWLVGIIFHQGGTISTILAGTTVRPITDRQRVSHEEVSYIIDSTASPVATIIPLNAWPLYVAGLVAGTIPLFATEGEATQFFFRSIFFNYYAVFAVLMTLLFSWDLLPWVGRKMDAARERARTTGELDAPGADPLAASELTVEKVPANYPTGMADFVVPLGVLIGVALTGVVPALLAWTRTGDAAALSGIDVPIAEAFGLSVLSAFVVALIKGLRLKEAVAGFVDGCKGVTIGALILALAVTLGQVSRDAGTAAYLVETTADAIAPAFLPAMLLALCMAVAFSIGSSWGTYAVVFPIAMPLAWALVPDPTYIALCFGATLGGAVFGDQCSPISDTTILSALATGSDLMDHVTTQLPLALIAASAAAVLYTAVAFAIL